MGCSLGSIIGDRLSKLSLGTSSRDVYSHGIILCDDNDDDDE